MSASIQSALGIAPSDALLPRCGWLRHGNRPGDYAKAPRCGARTRAGGCCRQPAMKNGRCRMHGGLSTGPRTPAGLARSRRARWKHGIYSAEIRALLRAARLRLRRTRSLRARLAGSPAGHGVHRSNWAAASGMPAAKINHRGHREGVMARCARRRGGGSVTSVFSVVDLSSAHSRRRCRI